MLTGGEEDRRVLQEEGLGCVAVPVMQLISIVHQYIIGDEEAREKIFCEERAQNEKKIVPTGIEPVLPT